MTIRTFGRDLWLSWAGVIAILLLWQVVVTLELVNPAIFPGPMRVVRDALTLVSADDLLQHVWRSLLRIIQGFLIGGSLGVVVGVTAGWYRWLGSAVRTPIELLRPIPPLAWIPLALIWFGLGESSKVFIIALGAFFPVVTNAYKGMIGIDPDLLRAAQTLGVRGWRLLPQVALPAALPDIAIGVRVGWSLSFGALVAAEILAASQGLGFMIMNARELGQIGVIIYGIILIGMLNLITDYLIREFIFKRQLKWHFGGMQTE
jgi:ABC-type nitrate/sulfonate/bicarbonate transport system permease component